jgi:hypothetical protein
MISLIWVFCIYEIELQNVRKCPKMYAEDIFAEESLYRKETI